MELGQIKISPETRSARAEAHERLAMIERIDAEKSRVINKAINLSEKLKIFAGELSRPPEDKTAIVVTELCPDSDIDDYAKVACFVVTYVDSIVADGITLEDGAVVVRVEMGVAFNSQPDVVIPGEEELGEGLNRISWFGKWDSDKTESTDKIQLILTAIFNGNLSALQKEKLEKEAMDLLASITQSLDTIEESAENQLLNPVFRKTPQQTQELIPY